MVLDYRFRWRISALALLAYHSVTTLVLATGPTGSNEHTIGMIHNLAAPATGPRPLYAIAHRVLTVQGVKDALGHGANALEIDATAWPSGWLADHDASLLSVGDTIEIMFQTIAEERQGGKNAIFVWLDIKNPDWCDPSDSKLRHCSITALREQARQVLEPANVRVLYGFPYAGGKAYDLIRDDLNANEAINLNGEALKVKNWFDSSGPSDPRKRVMSYGYDDLPFEFGNCFEPTYYTCTELRQATQSKVFGQVFGWTLTTDQEQYANKLLGDAGVDGIIYGFRWTNYYDHPGTRAAFRDIKNWENKHPKLRYLAMANNTPW
ncbi:Phospholipase D [Tolypocladium paradoxum]|uniref:Phospholipase D n=1 Tax=Tolypocladium paradoxum TaxID=94208 RepID=A0A2S4L782_9HYPO|nr:Phospholipase D [Tolypocladium paradoxum]